MSKRPSMREMLEKKINKKVKKIVLKRGFSSLINCS